MVKIYAGIGSTETPDDVCELMQKAAARLAEDNWLLRSGGARGADTAFEKGAGDQSEIWLPQPRHNGHTSRFICPLTQEIYDLAAHYHPKWSACSPIAKKLHARNGNILLGRNLDTPVKFVICWTADGKASGGTGQGIRIAEDYGIPVFNLQIPEARHRLETYLGLDRANTL